MRNSVRIFDAYHLQGNAGGKMEPLREEAFPSKVSVGRVSEAHTRAPFVPP